MIHSPKRYRNHISNVQAVMVSIRLTEFTTIPKPLNATLNGPNAAFHCSATHEPLSLVWEVNETAAQKSQITARGITFTTNEVSGTLHSTLSVPPTERNNNTRIQCLIWKRDGKETTEFATDPVVLKVQGTH